MASRPRSQTKNAKQCRARRKKKRAALISILGGRCENCGTEKNLEPHHTEPRTWKSAEVWALTRLNKYLAEAAAGKLKLLCRGCNAAAGMPADAENSEF